MRSYCNKRYMAEMSLHAVKTNINIFGLWLTLLTETTYSKIEGKGEPVSFILGLILRLN